MCASAEVGLGHLVSYEELLDPDPAAAREGKGLTGDALAVPGRLAHR